MLVEALALAFFLRSFYDIVFNVVFLKVVELLSMEDVDLTPEQIQDIVNLLEKENRLQQVDDEQSVKDTN